MKNALSGPVVVGVLAVVLIGLVIYGYRMISGPKQGEKPQLDPVLNRMYGANPLVNEKTMIQNQTNTPRQGP